MSVGSYVSIGVAVLLVVLFVYALARKRSERRKELAEPGDKKALEAKKERVEPGLSEKPIEGAQPLPRREKPAEKPAQTEAQLAARRAEEAAEAARLEAKRLVEEARQAKDDAEIAKKAEEARLAAQKAREEEVARQKAEEEQAKRLAEEEQKKKVAAQAGKTLSEGLAKTRGGFMASLNSLFGRAKVVDESVLGELEEVLFSADIGVKTATELLNFAREKVRSKDLADAEKLKAAMRQEVRRIVDVGGGRPPDYAARKPFVIMVAGVNGSGKTTTIGKLAAKLTAQGKKVLLAAGDTFRAAATEQLEVWGQRANAPVIKAKEGSDPGAVIFDAIKRAQTENFDVLLCDTAGRLHTKAPLMEELKRVRRVMDKAMPGSPHDVLLVLDSTNGQNAIAQAREFNAALEVDGLVLSKLDGTAKGGVVIGICDELKIPVRFVGIGETVNDLKPFDPEEFVRALFD